MLSRHLQEIALNSMQLQSPGKVCVTALHAVFREVSRGCPGWLSWMIIIVKVAEVCCGSHSLQSLVIIKCSGIRVTKTCNQFSDEEVAL
jgi:hypothetical protein